MSVENIVSLIADVFFLFIFFRFFRAGFNHDGVNRVKETLAYVAFFIVTSVIYLTFNNPLLNLFGTVSMMLLVSSVYKAKWKSRIFMVLIIFALMVLVETVSVYAVMTLGLKTISTEIDMEIITMYVVSKILLYIAVLVFEKFTAAKNGEQLPVTMWIAITMIPVASVVAAVLLFVELANPISVIMVTIILFVINLFVFYLYDRQTLVYLEVIDKQFLKQQNIAYGNQLKLMEESLDNVRIIKHDMNNHFNSIRSFLSKGNSKEALEHIGQAEEFLVNSNEIKTGNTTIDSILNYKALEASKIGIELVITTDVPSEMSVDSFDLTVILGNIIDNAFEATLFTSKKSVELNISFDRTILYVSTKNHYDSKRENEKNRNGRGLGLKSVKKVVNKYNGLIETDSLDNVFDVNIMLYTW